MQIDYWDVYSTDFVTQTQIPVDSVVKEFFLSMPNFVVWLLTIRELIAKQIGLKTSNGKQSVIKEINSFKGNIGEQIALFEVWNRTEKEILTGQQDKHLDFALSFYLNKHKEKYELKLITIVQINNTFGKIYFFLIKPFHKLIMPLIVKRIKNRLIKTDTKGL